MEGCWRSLQKEKTFFRRYRVCRFHARIEQVRHCSIPVTKFETQHVARIRMLSRGVAVGCCPVVGRSRIWPGPGMLLRAPVIPDVPSQEKQSALLSDVKEAESFDAWPYSTVVWG